MPKDGASEAADERRARPLRRLGRADWVACGLRLLGDSGVAALRLDALCARMGVTKGSFYWHFESRAGFLAALLEAWEERETSAMIQRVDGQAADPVERLRALFAESQSGRVDFAAELAIRQLARRDRAAAGVVRRVEARRIGYMQALFRAAGCDEPEARTRTSLLYATILSEGLTFRGESRAERAARLAAILGRILPPAAGPDGGPAASGEPPAGGAGPGFRNRASAGSAA